MTRNEFYQIVGYLANPIRNTRIEIEAKQSTLTRYSAVYQVLSGLQLSLGSETIFILDEDADKWGREMRVYFTVNDANSIPSVLNALKTKGGRPGYDLWNFRLNNRDIVDDLFSVGFSLDYPQNHPNIQAQVHPADLAAFNLGYNAP